MPRVARSKTEVAEALALIAAGHSDHEVGRRLGIPKSTALNWRRGKIPAHPPEGGCSICLGPRHDLAAIDSSAYCYLLASTGCV